ncbi:MAG: AraC family transcriptional regulator [Burkholderiales bacterium]|nr:AraC family transcriptional regulator [Burkholderiales bacterium]
MPRSSRAAVPVHRTASSRPIDIEQVVWQPPPGYALDIEIRSVRELLARVSQRHLRAVQRIRFHMLMTVTRGRCTHVIDFIEQRCVPGSVIVLRPGQVHRFDPSRDWDGWLVIFRPELLLPIADPARDAENGALEHALSALPSHLALETSERQAVDECIARMALDAAADAPAAWRNALLRHQLYALLLRARWHHARRAAPARASAADLARFERFRALAESDFAQRRTVADYAAQLGCSEKTLARAAMAASGAGPKAWLQARIALEARRLLAHTAWPVGVIADHLGFAEATQFVKFFRREAGCAPGAFRRRAAAAG